jgi:hypothetical protein
VAWNLRYQDEGETKQYWSINEHRTGSGAVARTERFYSIVQSGMHRPAPADNLAAWGKLGVYMKRYNLILGPADLEGTQALTYRYARDTRFNDKWIYDPKSRRTRKVVDNPYEPVMRLGLATPDEKKAAEGYTDSGSGVSEVERPWCLQPVYEPDPRTVFRHHAMLPPPR